MEEKTVKRKGYKTTEQQTAANKRYLENHPEQKIKNNICLLYTSPSPRD